MSNKFELGEDQVNALNAIKQFLNSDNLCYSVIGYAGTGKSTLIKEVVNHLDSLSMGYLLCAPTHKAKMVMERFSGREAFTLHKLLSLSPNLEIVDFDLKDLKFNMGLTSMFPNNSVIICDESSMINDDLFEMLKNKCTLHKSKIIFFGDKAQLKPVNANDFSKVFTLDHKSELKHIYRQSSESGLVDVLPVLRERVIVTFEDKIGTEGSLKCVKTAKDLFIEALPHFKKAIKDSDILGAKLLAYTNNRVNALNNKMRDLLFGKDKEYFKHEILTAYENLEFGFNKFHNSMDYIIIDEPEKININIPNFISLPGYRLNLHDPANNINQEVEIISKEVTSDYFSALAEMIESIRLDAINYKNQRNKYKASELWKMYYKIIKSFATPIDLQYRGRLIRNKSFSYGYASSIHKSQGSSINNVFIDMIDVKICRDFEELRQLQYVAVSRSKNNVIILQ